MTVTATLPRPGALLLDFGGVVASVVDRPSWTAELAAAVRALLDGAAGRGAGGSGVPGSGAPMPDIEDDIRAADAANTAWKAAMSRTAAPRELTATEFWGEFVACDWPGVWRAVVTERAAELCHRMGVLRSSRTVRPGIPALLRQADALGVPVAIVSNALSGRVHREFVAEHGLARGVSAQIYSDEVGLRKPNPALIRLAAAALGVDVGSAWFVGDTSDRDIRCARRAGVGAAILMVSDSIGVAGGRVSCRADATVADPAALVSLLGAACRRDQVSR